MEEKINFAEGIQVVDIPEEIKEEIAMPSLEFTDEDISSLRSAVDIETFNTELWESYKKEKLSKIGTDSVVLSEVFIFCYDFMQTAKMHVANGLKEKISFCLEKFEDAEAIRELIEQYGNGEHYGCHLIKNKIQKIARNRSDMREFVDFVTKKVLVEDAGTSIDIPQVSEELVTEKDDYVEENDPDYEEVEG